MAALPPSGGSAGLAALRQTDDPGGVGTVLVADELGSLDVLGRWDVTTAATGVLVAGVPGIRWALGSGQTLELRSAMPGYRALAGSSARWTARARATGTAARVQAGLVSGGSGFDPADGFWLRRSAGSARWHACYRLGGGTVDALDTGLDASGALEELALEVQISPDGGCWAAWWIDGQKVRAERFTWNVAPFLRQALLVDGGASDVLANRFGLAVLGRSKA